MLQGHLALNQQQLPHLGLKIRVATLEGVLHLFRMQGLLRRNPVDGRLGCLGQGRIARFRGMPAHVPGERTAGPQLGGVTELLGFAAGHVHHPGLGLFADAGFAGTMIGILERCFHPHGEGSLDPFANAFARRLQGPHNLGDRLAALIAPHDLGSPHLANRRRPR